MPSEVVIRAPFPAIFHRRPTPDDPPFVNPGQPVEKGATVCLLEIMKIYEVLLSPVTGLVSDVLAVDETFVSVGQPLFSVWAEGETT